MIAIGKETEGIVRLRIMRAPKPRRMDGPALLPSHPKERSAINNANNSSDNNDNSNHNNDYYLELGD